MGEIRQRREHTFWKNRYVVKKTPQYTLQVLTLIFCSGWLQVGRSCLRTAKRSLRPLPPSNSSSPWNHYQSRQLQRRSRKRSGYHRRKVHWYLGRVGRWEWSWIEEGCVLSSVCTSFFGCRSFLSRLISSLFSITSMSICIVLLSITTCKSARIMRYNVMPGARN